MCAVWSCQGAEKKANKLIIQGSYRAIWNNMASNVKNEKWEDEFACEDVDRNNKLARMRFVVTSWETLYHCEMTVTRSLSFAKLLRALAARFPEVSSPGLYQLAPNSMWDRDRVRISCGEQLIRLLSTSSSPVHLYCCNLPDHEPIDMIWYSSSIDVFLNRNQDDNAKKIPYNNGKYDEEDQRLEMHTKISNSARSTSVSGATCGQIQVGTFEENVFLRDGDMCVFCSSSEDLKAVHILDWNCEVSDAEMASFMISGMDDVRNGLSLCGTCHELFSKHWIGITPERFLLVGSVPLLRDKFHSQQWQVLHGQQVRLPFAVEQHQLWPSEALLAHRFMCFEQAHSSWTAKVWRHVQAVARRWTARSRQGQGHDRAAAGVLCKPVQGQQSMRTVRSARSSAGGAFSVRSTSASASGAGGSTARVVPVNSPEDEAVGVFADF